MGDRCAAYVTCRQADVPKFKEEGFDEDCDEGDGLVHLCNEEANFGGTEALTALAKHGLAFFGHHEAGGNYGPCVFASDGKKYAEAISSEVGGEPVARVGEDGQVNAADVHQAARYFGTLARAKALLFPASSSPPSTACRRPASSRTRGTRGH